MATIYILKQGVTLTKRKDRIVVKEGKTVINTYPEMDVEKIVIFGKVSLTPHLMDFLLKKEIDTIFISSNGRYKGRLTGFFAKNIPLRISQFEAYKDNVLSFEIAKKIVYGKLKNSITLMRRLNWEHKSERAKAIIVQLRGYLEAVEFQKDTEKLRGLEGVSATIYFDILREFVKNEIFYFKDRNRRPPQDPANAVLSFLYTMLYHTVESAIYSVGLDPFIGFFHTIDYGKPALALDIMEEFRPIMDRIFLRMVNRGMLKISDFYFKEFENKEVQGVYLSFDGMKKVIASFQQELEKPYFSSRYKKPYPLLNIIFEQPRMLVKVIKREEAEYLPFEMEL